MNQEDKTAIKAELEIEIKELEERITELKESTKPVEPDAALGRLTRLDEMQSKSIRDAAKREAENKLRKAKFKLMTIGTALFEK